MLDLYLNETLDYIFIFKCHDRLNDNDLVFEKDEKKTNCTKISIKVKVER